MDDADTMTSADAPADGHDAALGFLDGCRVVVVAGKGGVGKTVLASALARAAAVCGMDVLLVEVGDKGHVAAVLGDDEWARIARDDGRAGDEHTLWEPEPGAPGSVSGLMLTPDRSLIEWLSLHGMRRVANQIARTGLLEIIATATPGIKDLLMLGKIKQLANEHPADLIVVDAPASGHAIAFLESPAKVAETARVGTLHRQADEVLEVIADHSTCQVVLVTLAEETPVAEVSETAFTLEDRVGLRLGPLFVNALVQPVPDAAPEGLTPPVAEGLARFAAHRNAVAERQAELLDELSSTLPLDQLRFPLVEGGQLGRSDVETLAEHLIREARP